MLNNLGKPRIVNEHRDFILATFAGRERHREGEGEGAGEGLVMLLVQPPFRLGGRC